MKLSGLLPLLREVPAFPELLSALRQGREGTKAIVPEAAQAFVLAGLWREARRPILVVAPQPERAQRLEEELSAWGGGEVLPQMFPEPDILPYERLTMDSVTRQERLQTLAALIYVQSNAESTGSSLWLTTAHALAWKTLAPGDFAAACQVLKLGMTLEREELLRHWLRLGYEPTATVEVPGTMSRRGGILDIYSPQYARPLRLELFGNRLESLRFFDPASQRSVEMVSTAIIVPAQELLLPDKEAPRVRDSFPFLDLGRCHPEARERFAEELGRLQVGEYCNGAEFYAPLFHQGCLLDYLPPEALVVLVSPGEVEASLRELDLQAAQQREEAIAHGELPEDFPRPYFTWEALQEKLARKECLALEKWGGEADKGQLAFDDFTAPSSYAGRLPVFLKEVKEKLREGQRLLLVSQQAQRLAELLAEEDVFAGPVTALENLPPLGSLTLVPGSLSEGWVLCRQGTRLFTDTEIFGFFKERRVAKRRALPREGFLTELAIGDLVVHADHGIARFAGLTRMSVDGIEREYLVLNYAEGDRLYVPFDQVDRVSRYLGTGDYVPALSRLGTQEWTRAKEKVKESTAAFARELLTLYSARAVAPGITISPDTSWQQEMEAAFLYVETPDQWRAIREVKADMERPRPMDRLVCGDVGYGKTEVALRAAFKAVMSGLQVAVLVPTTVLAQQHLITFSQRLAAFPVKVEMLSRFRSEKEQREVVEGLKEGRIDICIGTHRLLQKDVAFKNLGLVIVDEEQHFGVEHKERLKRLRQEVDVLTLSATPIPRTLHMSLLGARDMSTMETPPEERLAIKTYVSEYNDRLIREAILREMERGGQVFFVHNRVQSIYLVAARLASLVPEARIRVGHGQMPEEKLERGMLDFAQKKSDVLVCTTIIESGLDLPNANTLIVNQADRLGLAQLYQLRGRVGRSSQRAYAYFLFDSGKKLTPTAEKRLKTILAATELGAGFRIALKDLEIRGAGNILGPEQSGHIGAVGFELYSRLLAEAVAELKAKQFGQAVAPAPPAPPSIDLPLSAHIPEGYMSDETTRLILYQRLLKVASLEELTEIEGELQDRFGPLVAPVQSLLYIVRARLLGQAARVRAISREEGQIVVRRAEEIPSARLLERSFGRRVKVGHTQVRLDMKGPGGPWPELLLKLLQAMREDAD